MNEINKFYQLIMQDTLATQESNENGDFQEQVFTRIATDMLSEAGETENVVIAYDERALGTRNQHKINAFSISDNYETVDLFNVVFDNISEIRVISKSEVETAAKRIKNFFIKAFEKKYVNEIAESSEILTFAHTLANYQELREKLVRINAVILTNGEYKGDFPKSEKIGSHNIYYWVKDINYFYKISAQARAPIEISFDNFEGEQFSIPCLIASTPSKIYKTYIAIMPGLCLAKLYEKYGARLLEQNVRSFLQFSGKINKAIRDTIRNEPQMFLAFNNGIAATADKIILDESNQNILKINNLQIVNGGQTMASIYNTYRKEKVNISNIYVQVKLSIIEDSTSFNSIVSRISKYANTQNKINDADFTANNPSLIAFEKISRYTLSPVTSMSNIQTCWFFERARGQYKTLRSREGTTKSRLSAFDRKYPKKQVFTKVEFAKYINAYKEICKNSKVIIGPHFVVRGNEKNYNQFITHNLPDSKHIKTIFFEDTVAKCILFKTAERRYGTKINDYNIGELRQVVVPYSLSLLNILTEDKLDIYKIWKNQCISQELSDFLYELMKQVNQFILDNSPISHYIEWAKKEECWLKVKNSPWQINIADIESDLINEKNPQKRHSDTDCSEDELRKNREKVLSLPFSHWVKIKAWGKDSNFFDIKQQARVSNIVHKIQMNKPLSDRECSQGAELIDIVSENNVDLLTDS
jgi:hypothetical protein